MLENINLKDFPKESGVYWILDENNVIVYVGSSKNLYQRMTSHRKSIINGGEHNGTTQLKLYQFLQSNHFTVEYQLEENYLQLEQKMIDEHHPQFNIQRAYTGIGKCKNRTEYRREHRHKFHEENLRVVRTYRESHKKELKEYTKKYTEKYYKRLCSYNGEILTLNALKLRFIKQGVEHPNIEAKKYLIG
jgi:excinuclease UvrABC nuclease subunit